MSGFTTSFQIAYLAWAALVFCFLTFVTGTRRRRLVGALASVAVGQALIFVGGVALVGGGVQRRWGVRGLGVFAIVVCCVGFVRDMTAAAIFPTMIRFGRPPAAQLADVGAWAVVVIVALGVTRSIAEG